MMEIYQRQRPSLAEPGACAFQLGRMERLFTVFVRHLRMTGRGGNPHQASRVGEAALAVETARLWSSEQPLSPKVSRRQVANALSLCESRPSRQWSERVSISWSWFTDR